jgi:hypothetical protein
MWERTQSIFAESVERAVMAMARVAPGLLALLLVFAVFTVASLLVRAGLARLCERIELDRWAVRWGLASPDPARVPPSHVVARFGAWSLLVVGLLLGLAIFDAAADTAFSSRLADYAPHVLAAALIALGGVAVARALERQLLIGAVNLGLQSARILAGTARWVVLAISLAMALDHLGIGGRVLPIAFGVVIGGVMLALSLAVGLGARDAVSRALERRAGGEEPAKRVGDDLKHM